jgi:hypothetical protein
VTRTREQSPSRPLLTLRTLVLLVVSVLIGAAAGVLTATNMNSIAGAVLAGAAAFGASLKTLHELVE